MAAQKGRQKLPGCRDFACDPAGAAKLLAQTGGEGKAAIASKRAAEAYGLTVLAENIEDLAKKLEEPY